jgi:hypothetical protein
VPVVDHERAWVKLKAHIVEKRSHGQDELLRTMTDLEVLCEIPEEFEGFDDRPRRTRSGAAQPNGKPAERVHR